MKMKLESHYQGLDTPLIQQDQALHKFHSLHFTTTGTAPTFGLLFAHAHIVTIVATARMKVSNDSHYDHANFC